MQRTQERKKNPRVLYKSLILKLRINCLTGINWTGRIGSRSFEEPDLQASRLRVRTSFSSNAIEMARTRNSDTDTQDATKETIATIVAQGRTKKVLQPIFLYLKVRRESIDVSSKRMKSFYKNKKGLSKCYAS
ncbi:uncharacterized protein LOC107782887 isoform X3 [Nicotiana tabacum]|uniref:Uncharacterized protein LOC107782887 isoform X3 n=1 Tax=Nicotiana tabacum TaxID=4097 RepID=A0A1S3Z521_TOBAC|nr:PREDICTED: uncharacterized protein LOC107782887 isoform X2 [Nicotiana tabacum]